MKKTSSPATSSRTRKNASQETPPVKAQKKPRTGSSPALDPLPKTKKVPRKKIVKPVALKMPEASPSEESIIEAAHSLLETTSPEDGIKLIGILHVVGNILSSGILGILLVTMYLILKKTTISPAEKQTCYEVINFNLSFWIYAFVGYFSIKILIGFVLFPAILCVWFVLMVVGFIQHLEGKNYTYPFIIRFIS